MDKQAATDFILDKLRQGHEHEQIAQELSGQLGAPFDLIKKFVQQTAAENPDIQPPAVELPSWLGETPVAELPPWLTETPSEEPAAPFSTPQATPDTEIPVQSEAPAQSEASAFPPPTPEASPVLSSTAFTSPEETPSPPATPQKRARQRSPEALQDPELAKMVLSLLKKNRKRSDIVMLICERTGVDWPQAQRFVAQVEVEKHKQISTHRNWFLFPLGLLFILGGLGLMLVGLATLAPYIIGLTGVELELPFYLNISGRPSSGIEFGLGVLATGFFLILGGITGIYLALRNR